MSTILTDVNYLVDQIIGTDGLVCWLAKDSTAAKNLVQRFDGKEPAESAAALERLIEGLSSNSRIEFTFSKHNGEEKQANVNKARGDYKVTYQKPSSYQSAAGNAVGAVANNREDLLTDRFMMEMRYRDDVRDLKDKIKELETAKTPGFGEALLGNLMQDPNGIDKMFMLAGALIDKFKGRPTMPAANVAGYHNRPINGAVSDTNHGTDTISEEEQRVQNALQILAENEPDIINVLEGLARFVSNPANRSTYEMIKPTILNA